MQVDGVLGGIGQHELIIDNFAGGGGASLGIELALGHSPDIAVNHDQEAVAMHAANHPATRHYCEDVWDVDPVAACAGRPVGLAWFSPDCKHFSKAKGGKPVSKKIRGLAWIVVKWAKAVRPRVIILENVEEFQDWGPLLDDGRPCPMRKGFTFRRWIAQLKNLGYRVEWRELRACDFGAPTIRKRLFLIARCDGLPIVWPTPTHGDPKKRQVSLFDGHLPPWRTVAGCIDWSIPCPSIFERRKPLAENTLRRVAAGIRRYVIEAAEPFIVNLTHAGEERVEGLDEPMRTVTGANRGEKALVTPYFVGAGGPAYSGKPRPAGQPLNTLTADPRSALVVPTLIQTGYGEREGQAPRVPGLDKPLGTVVGCGQKHALVTAFLAKHYGGVVGSELSEAIGTVTAKDHHSLVAATLLKNNTNNAPGTPTEPLATITTGGRHAVVASHLVKLHGTCKDGQPVTEPIATVRAEGTHIGEVRAFLVKYRGAEHAEPTFVTIDGEQYVIADIGMRMLSPRELYRAQGFPDTYIIDPVVDGEPLTKTAQVRMCGNSVCPPLAAAVAGAQFAARRSAVA